VFSFKKLKTGSVVQHTLLMPEAIQKVMLAGNGLLRWPGREERVHYRLVVGFDGAISRINITPTDLDILRRPTGHLGLYLHMPEGRRISLNLAPNGYVIPDGPLELSLDGQDWWVDSTPWLPFETADRVTLSMRCSLVQVFETHQNEEEARVSYRQWKAVDAAEIRPPFGKPILLGLGLAISKGGSE
jgi:hypothetical protein